MDIHVESLQNLFASLTQHSSPLPPIPALPALHRGDVIEIQGPAASGKTHLLYHILLSVLVPARAQIAAVVYDTDLSFDIRRFRHLLLSRLSDRARTTGSDTHECVRRALGSLHIFRPASLAQLAASIANLTTYHSSQMPNQEIALLAVDSMSTFYWPDRFSTEQLRATGSEGAGLLHNVLGAIQAVRRSICPLVVLTNWALGPGPPYRHHLRPFPTVHDRIADLGAKVPANTDQSSSPFRLAHHIALSSPPLDHDPPPHGTSHENRLIHCLSTAQEAQHTLGFSFRITNDDVLFLPEE